MSFDLAITLAASIVIVALLAFAAWRSGKPRPDTIRGRGAPWRLIVFLCGAALLIAVVHAVNLMGLHTGNDRLR